MIGLFVPRLSEPGRNSGFPNRRFARIVLDLLPLRDMLMQKWLARLSFSFFIIAFVLAWELNKTMRAGPGTPKWKIGLYTAAIALAIALGAVGVKARHRS